MVIAVQKLVPSLPHAAFHTCGADRVQLAPKMRKGVMLAGMTGRAEISHFAIAGKALVGCHLFSRSPGIRGIDFSFLEPPTVDVQV